MWPGVAARTIDAVTFDDIPVLVVGAGPAGLAAAIELTRHDIPCLLVERRTLLSSHPRATALSLRSMELVRAWGLESGVRARSVDVDWRMLESETLADAASGTAIAVGYPNAEQSRMVSPTAPACVAQDDVEPLLLERLRAAPRARVELGTELTGVFAGPDGARAQLRDVSTGALRAARCAGHPDDRSGRSHGGLHHAVPHAAVGRGRRAPPPDLLGDPRRDPRVVHPRRAVGPLAVRAAGRRAGRPARREAHPAGCGRARPAGARRAVQALLGRGAARGALAQRLRLPGRRRRAPRDAAGRDGPEPRDARRLRPRLEARVGAARLGRARAARLLRDRAPTRRRVHRRAVGRPRRLAAPGGERGARGPRR